DGENAWEWYRTNLDGKELPGPCSNYQPTPTVPSEEQFGQNEEDRLRKEEEMKKREQEDRQRQLKDMKRWINNMSNNLNRLERMFQSAEKKGTAIPAEVKERLTKTKETVNLAKAAQSVEELEAIDLEAVKEDIQALEEARQEYVDAVQRLQDMKRNIKNFEQEIKQFEKQINTLKKQKMAVPAQVTENIEKLKSIIATIKNAKTWAEVEEMGFDQMQEYMNNLQENRQQLEMLARWPQTLKDLDRQLKQFANELKRSKTIVTRLQKQGIDIGHLYAEFESGINKLKAVRDDAANKIKSGDAETIQNVFESLQDDFFSQTEDIWQNQRIIQTMSNLGQFAREFKQGTAQAQQQINQLKRQKIDTAELEDLLNQAKSQGNDVLALVKIKPVDEDAIISGLMDMEGYRQEFDSKMQELLGKEQEMPWEKGPQQFKTPQLNFDIKQFATPKKTPPVEESNPQPSPAPAQ
ncbi:MAG: hypothetical protein AAB956_02490, partial [Patescibacteria group bacterium]